MTPETDLSAAIERLAAINKQIQALQTKKRAAEAVVLELKKE